MTDNVTNLLDDPFVGLQRGQYITGDHRPFLVLIFGRGTVKFPLRFPDADIMEISGDPGNSGIVIFSFMFHYQLSDLTNQPGDVSHATPPSGRASQSVSQQQEYLERLDYVFQRLRQARQPYCANNGVLTIFPHSVFRDILFAKDLPNAIHQDLATLRHATQLSSPVTVLVTGMEAEPGFSELALRVGLDRARKSRIGKGFNVWNKATDENLDALASHACGAFEDHIYGMFKTDDGFDNPTNGNLYAMLCRLRRDLQPKIRRALVHGCSTKSENEDRLGSQLPILFGGCYFGSTGNLDEEQVFVRSVIDARLPELCEELQYSDKAHREDARYLGITRLLAVVNVGLFAGVLYYAFQILK